MRDLEPPASAPQGSGTPISLTPLAFDRVSAGLGAGRSYGGCETPRFVWHGPRVVPHYTRGEG